MQEVVLADGRSYATINVNLGEAEMVRYRIWDAENDKGVRSDQEDDTWRWERCTERQQNW